jgi:DNA polymerase III gamma/tau subunit
LLKTLEEPPDDTVLLLLTDRPGDLLPTIRSRCQTLDFGAAEPAPARTELELAGEVIRALGSQGYGGVFDKAAFVDGSRKKRLPAFFAALEFLLRRSLVAHFNPAVAEKDLTEPLPATLAADSRRLLAALDEVWQAGYFLERNVNSLLILENLFLKLKKLDISVTEGG